MTAISLQARKKRIGKIQERYGLKKQEAQRQVEEWNATLADENAAQTEAERNRSMGRAG